MTELNSREERKLWRKSFLQMAAKNRKEFGLMVESNEKLHVAVDRLLRRWKKSEQKEDLRVYALLLRRLTNLKVLSAESNEESNLTFIIEPERKGIGIVRLHCDDVGKGVMNLGVEFTNWFLYDGTVEEKAREEATPVIEKIVIKGGQNGN